MRKFHPIAPNSIARSRRWMPYTVLPDGLPTVWQIAYMFGNGKVSGSSIAAFVEILCGDGTEAAVSMGSILEVRILSENAGDAAHQQLMAYLGRVLPAHLSYAVIYEGYMRGIMYNGAVWHDMEIFEIRQVV